MPGSGPGYRAGLPTGLVQTGASTIIGTLWDRATSRGSPEDQIRCAYRPRRHHRLQPHRHPHHLAHPHGYRDAEPPTDPPRDLGSIPNGALPSTH